MSIAKLTIYAGFPDISACFFLTLSLFHSGVFLILCRVESDAK